MRGRSDTLTGTRCWSAVVALATALAVLLAGQLPTASADAAPSAPRVLPVAAAGAGAAGSADATDRLPRARRPGPLPARAAAPAAAPAAAASAPAASQAARAPSVLCSGEGWQQRRGEAALVSLRPGAAARTGFRVEFRGARKGYMGLTHLHERRIEMFVRACGTQSDELLRHVMAHELGHAYDTVRMNDATRAAWKAARGIPARTPWYGCSACTDFATPAGDFAEVYAQWARGASSNRSELAGDVPPATLAALASRFFGA